MSCDAFKWECEYCTFCNWPASKKCTMCRALKPLGKIEDFAPAEQIASRNHSFIADKNERIPTDDVKYSSWPCHQVGLRSAIKSNPNKLNALNCDKVKSSSTISFLDSQSKEDSSNGESNATWTDTCNTENYASATATVSLNSNDSSFSASKNLFNNSEITYHKNIAGGEESLCSVEELDDVNGAKKMGDENVAKPNVDLAKWTCHACTYDNWPKSNTCVMCFSERTRTDDSFQNQVQISSQPSRSSETVMVPPIENLSIEVGVNSPKFNYEANQAPLRSNYSMFNECSLDQRWIEACRGVIDGHLRPVEEYLAAGGDPTRQLTKLEASILNKSATSDSGLTLVHLALRFQRENVLAILLSQVDGARSVTKRVPSYSAPEVAMDIRRNVISSFKQRKGTFRCYYTSDLVTFSLPADIESFSGVVQETLFDEILDRDVQKELEEEQIINWTSELTETLHTRLYALWNRSAGDCLLDSVLQATWGIFDRDNGLRRTIAESLQEASTTFYPRWRENELLHAQVLNFSLNESQFRDDWTKLLALARQPGASLEHLHIFTLAHIFRRPIIVYGVKYVKSFRGETLGYARYEGVYLPFLWDPSFCWKCPIALGYTRGHFSALVPMEPDCDPMMRLAAASHIEANDVGSRATYLPLCSYNGTLLPIHFMKQTEVGKEEMILNQWLDVCYTNSGLMLARQKIQKRPLLVSKMIDEWLNHYRRIRDMDGASYMRPTTTNCYSSDGESDND